MIDKFARLDRRLLAACGEVFAEQVPSGLQQRLGHLGEPPQKFFEIIGVDADQFDVVEGRERRGAAPGDDGRRRVIDKPFDPKESGEQTDLAEVVAGRDVTQDAFGRPILLAEADKPEAIDVERVGDFPLAKDRLAGVDGDQPDMLAQPFGGLGAVIVAEPIEDAERSDLSSQPSVAIDLVEEFTCRLVSLHHVEDVATDLDDGGRFAGDYGRGTGVIIEAGHFAQDDVICRDFEAVPVVDFCAM